MEFDPIALLSNPWSAFKTVFPVLCGLTWIFFRIPATLSGKHKLLYSKAMSLVAEILVSVGLLGLVTFVGRTKEVAIEHEAAANTRNTEHDLSESLSLLGTYCTFAPQNTSPTAKNGTTAKACDLWKTNNAIYRESLDWTLAASEFERLAKAGSVNPRLNDVLVQIPMRIHAMQIARSRQATLPEFKQILSTGSDWLFVLVCASAATVGVAIKCGRAGREFKDTLKSNG